MINRYVLLPVIFCIFLLECLVWAETKPVSKGSRFPNVYLQNNLSSGERLYLGLTGKTTFSLRDVRTRLLVIEVFSTYCTVCPQDVPSLNDLYSSIEKDARLKGKVKVIAIAAGNTVNEVTAFKTEYETLYPIIPDVDYSLHKAVGSPRVPYTILVAESAKGRVILYTHQGVINSSDALLDKISGFLFQ